MTNLCYIPMGIKTLQRVPSAGHGRTAIQHSSQVPKGTGEDEMLNMRSSQRGENIQTLLKALQGSNPHCEFSQNTASHTHTSHPKIEPRQNVVHRNRKPVPAPRKSKGITPRRSTRCRTSYKRTLSSGGEKQNQGTADSGCAAFRVSSQFGHMRRKPPIKPRMHTPSHHRAVSISTQTADRLKGDKDSETSYIKGVTSEDSFTELEYVNPVSDNTRTWHSASGYFGVADEADSKGLPSPQCDATHRQREIPVPRTRRPFDLPHSYVSGRGLSLNYNPDMSSPPRTGNSLVDEDWIDEPIFEVREPAKPALLPQRSHSQLHRLSNVVGLSYHQRAGSYMGRSRVALRPHTEVVHETDQCSDVDSDDGQWETDTSSDDDTTNYIFAESAPELTHQRSPMARHPQTGAEKNKTKQTTTKDANDEDYVLVSPSDSLASSPRVPPGGSILDKHVPSHSFVSRLQSSDSIDVKLPLAKRNTHRTLCSTDSNYSVSSLDSSLDVTPSPPLPKREPKNPPKSKLVTKKQVSLSQLVSIPSDKRRPSDCLPRPPPPPPHRVRQRGKKRSETDSEYDDWKSCDSSHNSVRSLDTVLKGRGPPPLPPRSTGSGSGTGGEKGEKTTSDTDTKPLFDKRALEATLSLEIPYQSDYCTNNKSRSRSRGVYADNASTTSEGLSDLDQDTDLRSTLNDHSSDTPYYLELIADDDHYEVPKKSRFDDEPLYQIYHQSIIARNLQWQNENDTDSSSAPPSRTSSLLNPGRTSPIITGSKKSTIQALVTGTDANASRLWCDMPEVINSGVLDTMNTAEKKLQETLFEIITSEASYLKSLHLVISHFVESVEFDAVHSPAAILTKRDYKILFSNIISVWTISARFLGLLERVWNHSCVLSPGQVCGIIAEYAARHFDVYINYCTNQMFQNRKLGELNLPVEAFVQRFTLTSSVQLSHDVIVHKSSYELPHVYDDVMRQVYRRSQHETLDNSLYRKNDDFMDVLTRLENHPQCNSLSMRSFLLLPVQRVTRLPLLVDGVCHRMDTASPDYPVAMKCLHVLQKLAKQCNEGARRMQNLEEVTRINQLLDFRNVRTIALVSESRSLVKHGQLTRLLPSSQGILDKWTRRKELLHLFLFNDILLITRKRGERYQVIDSAPRISIHADIIQEDQVVNWLPNGSPRNCKNLFVMALLEKATEYIFSADSMSERTRWVEATTPSQQVNEDETIYESWDCPQVQVIERYEPKQPDELQLEESDVVDVFRKMADGWYEGERIRDGEKGWFPSSCVVEIMGEHRRAKNMRQRYRLLHSMQAFN